MFSLSISNYYQDSVGYQHKSQPILPSVYTHKFPYLGMLLKRTSGKKNDAILDSVKQIFAQESNGPLKDTNHILTRLFICGITGRSFDNCKIQSSFLGDLYQLFDFWVLHACVHAYTSV